MRTLGDSTTYLLLLAVGVATAIAVGATPSLRGAAAWLLTALLAALRLISAKAAGVFDRVLPVNARNGRVPVVALWRFAFVNLGIVAAEAALAAQNGQRVWLDAAGLLSLSFLILNVLFLAGAYWALREGIDVMNGDKAYLRRQFSDLSTARNVRVVCLWFAIAVFQAAAVSQWLQERSGTALIAVHDSFGVPYLDHLLAIVSALPLISVLTSVPEIAGRVAFEPGWGMFCGKAITAFGSLLIVSTLLGFVQQHVALNRMIERSLSQTNPGAFARFLRWRLLRAPSVIKRYLRQAFLAETDDGRRLKLLQLAAAKHSFSAPLYFIRSYAGQSDAVKAGGARVIADFTARQSRRFDGQTLVEICTVAGTAFAARAFPTRDDTRRAAEIILPCLERITRDDLADELLLHTGRQIARRKPIQIMLAALLYQESAGPLRSRAAELLIRARAQDRLPDLVRCLQYMDDRLRLRVLQGVRSIVEDRGTNFPDSSREGVLGDMIRTIDWMRKTVELRGAVAAELQALRTALVHRQQG